MGAARGRDLDCGQWHDLLRGGRGRPAVPAVKKGGSGLNVKGTAVRWLGGGLSWVPRVGPWRSWERV